jgi:ABC-type transport system substrate-binding protein
VTSVAAGPALFARVYNVLLDRSRRNADFFFMDLAEEFEQPDDETIIFKIRPGVKIAPNNLGIPERDMDAIDALRWMERIRQDENAVARAFTEPWVDSFEAPSTQEFSIRTKGPYAYFFFRIGPPLGGTIPPREFFEQDISMADKGVGAGPWALRPGSYQENGRAIVDRNPNYYGRDANGNQLPYVDTIEWTQILDRQPRRTAFLDKQIFAYGAQDRNEMEELRRQISGVQVFEDPSNTYISFTMNPTREPWTDDRIRRAAMLALNRQEYVDRIVGPEGGRINGLVHWSVPGALPEEELEQLQPYDPEQARELIRAATGNDTIRIKVMYPVTDIEFHDQHLPIWRQQMQAAGFELDEEALDFGTWLDRYTRVDYDASLSLNQIYETAEIDLDWHFSKGPQGDGNFAIGIGELFPEVDEAILESKRTVNPDELVTKVQEVQRLIYEKGPAFLPIMTWVSFTLYHPFVKNITPDLGSTGLYLTREWWLDLPS